MPSYYLLPTTLNTGVRPDPKLVRLFTGSRKKADAAAREYERELNNGRTWHEVSVDVEHDITPVSALETAYFVTPEPEYTARSYKDFDQWACNQEDEQQTEGEANYNNIVQNGLHP